MNKKFAIIIGGAGHRDGSEIQETIMTMLAIEKHNSTYELFAPDRTQYHVINHLTGEEMAENRNMLVEAARIARGKIKSLDDFNVLDFDAVIFPGGFGVAKNFFNYAFKGVKATVDEQIEQVIKEIRAVNKPIGALCISPVLLAKVLQGITVTIGNDDATAHDIELMGSHNINTSAGEVISDKINKIFTTPAYMLNASGISDIAEGADNLITAILDNM
ncbi:MAG: isoprenoid biosynthesis glyoxalase ElbB [Bacteroidales bacterium]|jgi:enhancing lycopene biosynthesis protein 2|nr:isoprenoid biosynthesis glyoxalase ElbB [Bacteroidales bacterium]